MQSARERESDWEGSVGRKAIVECSAVPGPCGWLRAVHGRHGALAVRGADGEGGLRAGVGPSRRGRGRGAGTAADAIAQAPGVAPLPRRARIATAGQLGCACSSPTGGVGEWARAWPPSWGVIAGAEATVDTTKRLAPKAGDSRTRTHIRAWALLSPRLLARQLPDWVWLRGAGGRCEGRRRRCSGWRISPRRSGSRSSTCWSSRPRSSCTCLTSSIGAWWCAPPASPCPYISMERPRPTLR
jgi:hypothetical protein